MYKGTPYTNKHVKKREQQRMMDNHRTHLHRIRPLTGTLDSQEITINNKKGQMQKQTRFTEIQRENRILLEKISSIMSKKAKNQPKLNKSLNSSFRRRQNQQIEIQNAKLLKRLQEKRPNYETFKYKQDWKKNKHVIKNLSNYPFIINDKKKFYRRTSSHFSKNTPSSNVIELCRVRVIDGVSFLITVRMDITKLQIIGDSKDHKEIKVIEIDRNQALEFLQQQCDGKLQSIFDRLRYDKAEEVLYLVGSNIDLDQLKSDDKQSKGKQDQNEEEKIQINKDFFENQKDWVQIKVTRKDQIQNNQLKEEKGKSEKASENQEQQYEDNFQQKQQQQQEQIKFNNKVEKEEEQPLIIEKEEVKQERKQEEQSNEAQEQVKADQLQKPQSVND